MSGWIDLLSHSLSVKDLIKGLTAEQRQHFADSYYAMTDIEGVPVSLSRKEQDRHQRMRDFEQLSVTDLKAQIDRMSVTNREKFLSLLPIAATIDHTPLRPGVTVFPPVDTYRRYADETLCVHVSDVVVDAERSTVTMTVDGKRSVFGVDSITMEGYRRGAVPDNVLANRIYKAFSEGQLQDGTSYSQGEGQQEGLGKSSSRGI